MALKITGPSGATFTRKFATSHTLRDVLSAVHASGCRLDPSRSYKLMARFGVTVSDQLSTLDAAGVQRGAYNVTEC